MRHPIVNVKNGFRRAFKGLDVKRYGKRIKGGSTGFYERFGGCFIGGLHRRKNMVLFVVIFIIEKLTADMTAIYLENE
jgi:hypothetical protein